MFSTYRLSVVIFLLLCSLSLTAYAQGEEEENVSRTDTSIIASRLSNIDPLVRQQAAEELAARTAIEHQKLIEGYRLQEKHERVRLALDWALYRMGKTSTLFNIVRALDSSRSNQARAYLTTLDDPTPLYIFFERASARTQIRLLEVLARVGNQETLARIQPYTASFDSKIASAAKFATREITSRLAEAPTDAPTRQRQVGKRSEESESP
jgi:hypothetical protein